MSRSFVQLSIYLSQEHKQALERIGKQRSLAETATAILEAAQGLRRMSKSRPGKRNFKLMLSLPQKIADHYIKEARRLNISVSDLCGFVIASVLNAPKVSNDHLSAADASQRRAAQARRDTDTLAEPRLDTAAKHYDEIRDFMRIVMEGVSMRPEVRLKLLELLAAAGERDQFLMIAREIAATRDETRADEWEKVLTLGKKIAPDDPLFANADAMDARAPSETESNHQTPAHEDNDVEPPPRIQLLIDPGSASASEIACLFAELSILYRMCGGSGLIFDVFDAREVERVLA